MRDKKQFRKTILDVRNRMSADEVVKKSSLIVEKLVLSEEYKSSKTVFIYMDFKNEVKTIDLIRKMLKDKKRVVIPYTDMQNTVIIPVEINNLEEDLALCSFGYLEPKKEKIVPVDPFEFDLIIVPGVVFDKKFNRIGFGKGYYDRILSHKRSDVKAIAFAYEFQVQEEIPFEEHDIKMDMIITENMIYER